MMINEILGLALRATSRPDYHQIDRGLWKLRPLIDREGFPGLLT